MGKRRSGGVRLGLPAGEEIAKLGDSFELLMVSGGGGVLERAGKEVEGVDNSVLWGDLGLSQVVVEDFDGVRDDSEFGGGVDDFKTAVLLESGADCETFAAAVVPRSTVAGFGLDDNGRAERGDGCGVKVEGAVEVLPGGHGRGNV